MTFARSAVSSIVFFTALAALPPSYAAEGKISAPSSSEITRRIYLTPATPLEKIPLYSLESSAPDAMRGLEAEVARLYSHATSLPSGPDRRAFQTRIYNIEKRLRPLEKQFNAEIWTEIRAAVRSEWESVQASLPPSQPATPVANAAPAPAKSERS